MTFATADDPATQRTVAQVACATSLVRGLTPRQPITVRLEDSASMKALMAQLAQRDGGYRALQQTASALQMLGALVPGENLASFSSDKYSATAVAEYSQYDKTLHVRSVKGQFTPLDLALVSHEYERALQDQYFNLSALLTDTGNSAHHNSDARLAREAVAEGDAFTTMLSYATSTFNRQQTLQFNQQLQQTPTSPSTDFVQDLLGFPASQGTTFVNALRAAVPGAQSTATKQNAANDAVNRALRNPPDSTAEVLNPALYTRRTTTPSVTLPESLPGLSPTWTAGASDVLGAFGIGDLLQRNTSPHSAAAQAAQQAAAAWQGDRWMLYQHKKDSLLIWRVHFASSSAAESFVRALASFSGARYHTTLGTKAPLDWATTGFALSIRQHSSDVGVAIGSDKSLLATCGKALKALGLS